MSQLNSRKKKTIAIVSVAVALVLGGGGAALAYWTASGTGTGTATTGEDVAFTITIGAHTGGPMTPGGATETVAFTVNNPGTGSQSLSSVVVTIAEAGGAVWNDVPGCSAADYTVGTPTIVAGAITGGSFSAGEVEIAMIDTGVNQNACQDAVVPLYFVAS